MKTNFNSFPLLVYIANNGDEEAKAKICQIGQCSLTALNRYLNNKTMLRREVRVRIYLALGIKLCEDDNFPSVTPREAS